LRCIATYLCYNATLGGKSGIMASTSLMDVVLDNVADGVFTVDPDLQITYWNRAAEEITGYPAGEALGRQCHEVFRASLCREECPMRQAIATGRTAAPADVEILTRDGTELTVNVSAAALRDRDGSFLGGVESFRDVQRRRPARDSAEQRVEVAGLVSRTQAMRRVLGILPPVARSDAPVLIRGPSGAGKELVARAIHRLSGRNAQAFLKLRGAAISDDLGGEEPHARQGERGSGFPAWVDDAAGGTLFLDEIADLSPASQARLLDILEQEVFKSLRGGQEAGAQIRVIASTRHDIERLVREGRFREDLYYRLGVITIDVPPLAERKKDVPMLVERALERLSRRGDRCVSQVAPEALRILLAHDYPGNVRELENVLEHAFVVGQGPVLKPEHFPSYMLRASAFAVADDSARREPDGEREELLAALRKHGRNKTLAALELGIHRSTLWRRMRKFGLAEGPPEAKTSRVPSGQHDEQREGR
jgi:PAS domain S-box-containing protein